MGIWTEAKHPRGKGGKFAGVTRLKKTTFQGGPSAGITSAKRDHRTTGGMQPKMRKDYSPEFIVRTKGKRSWLGKPETRHDYHVYKDDKFAGYETRTSRPVLHSKGRIAAYSRRPVPSEASPATLHPKATHAVREATAAERDPYVTKSDAWLRELAKSRGLPIPKRAGRNQLINLIVSYS